MNRPRWTTSARLSPARLTRPLGLQGQWCCWRPHTTVRTGTWASVVSRVGTLIDKRQPKLHVRMNFHGTYARAPYSEHRLYIPFSWRKRSTLPNSDVDNRACTYIKQDLRIAFRTLQRVSRRAGPRHVLSNKLQSACKIQAGQQGPPHKLQRDKMLNPPPALRRYP
jgi:hypothetical protein